MRPAHPAPAKPAQFPHRPGKIGGSMMSWFAIGFRRCAVPSELCPNAPQPANLVANVPLPQPDRGEPNCNQSRLKVAINKATCAFHARGSGIGGVMNLMLDGMGRAI